MITDPRTIAETTLQTIAECTLRHREGLREKYRDGVIEEAVRRATGLKDQRNIIDAIVSAFDAYRVSINPRWDGSIG